MTINKLSGEVKVFIVQSLACFTAPSAVARAVAEQFGVTITPQGVEAYNPHRRSGERLSQKWRQLFEETRKAFLEETSTIGISHRAVRLMRLEEQFELAEERGDSAVILKLLEQAAKEMGGTYTSRHAHAETRAAPTALQRPVDDRERARAVLLLLAKAKKLGEREGGVGER